MTSFVLTTGILFGLNFVSFPCEGKINLPSDGDELVVAPGEDVKIEWTFDDIETVINRQWFNQAGEIIAEIAGDGDVLIANTSLPGVNVTKPATLILKNVDLRHNQTYKFVLSVSLKNPQSSHVTVFIAVKPNVVIECSTHTTVNKSDDVKCLCKGQGGNPPASVTWYKNGGQFGATKVEENLLSLFNVNGTDSGTYKCVAQSYKTLKDKKTINVTVNSAPRVTSITSSPTKAVLGQSVTISCEASARPSPSYTIIHNGTDTVSNKKTYTIEVVNGSHAGSFQCIAKNFLGNSSKTIKLIVISKGSVQTKKVSVPTQNSSTKVTVATTNACIYNKVESGSSVVAWHVMVSLLSGIVIGIVLSYIVVYFRRRFKKMKPAQSKPEQQTGSKVDSIYQDLDLSKMNQDENYQTLGAVNSGNGESDYTELNLVRDVEDTNYQSFT